MTKPQQFDPSQLPHVSPLDWGHINLTVDYTKYTNKRVAKGGYRTLWYPGTPFSGP
jgi:hypothetical protein